MRTSGWLVAIVASLFVVGIQVGAQADIPEVEARRDRDQVKEERIDALTRRGDVGELSELARTHPDTTVRGWAIVGLSQVGGRRARDVLMELSASQHPPLIRTWAAAAIIGNTQSLAELREVASWRNNLPALERPLTLRVEALAGTAPMEDLLGLSTDPVLARAVAPVVMDAPVSDLVRVMNTHPEDSVRRQAAAFLASQGQQGRTAEVAAEVLDRLAFRRGEVPWQGGALFVPGLQWERTSARRLVKSLMTWWLWLERNGRQADTRPVWNNLYSVGLLQQAGYDRTLQANAQSIVSALLRVEGRRETQGVLERVGMLDDPRIRSVIR